MYEEVGGARARGEGGTTDEDENVPVDTVSEKFRYDIDRTFQRNHVLRFGR